MAKRLSRGQNSQDLSLHTHSEGWRAPRCLVMIPGGRQHVWGPPASRYPTFSWLTQEGLDSLKVRGPARVPESDVGLAIENVHLRWVARIQVLGPDLPGEAVWRWEGSLHTPPTGQTPGLTKEHLLAQSPAAQD